MAFETQLKIHFDEADPAGIAFSGHLFSKVHRCYEDFVEALNQDPKSFFLSPETIYPLRHYEGEYFKPLRPLEFYDVIIGVLKISESSFQLEYRIQNNREPMATFRSTHVAVNPKTFQKISIPKDLKQNLEKFVFPQ
ncbi:MAG: thioesterase family protein [Pseudomonadota bacterium]